MKIYVVDHSYWYESGGTVGVFGRVLDAISFVEDKIDDSYKHHVSDDGSISYRSKDTQESYEIRQWNVE